MWFCLSRVGRWPGLRAPWEPDQPAQRWVVGRRHAASRAEFPLQAGPTLAAHSTPGARADPAGWMYADDAAAHSPGEASFLAASTHRRDSGGQAERVDLMGVPGRFCLWIPKYLDCVWSVFSCRLEHLLMDTGITHLRWALQMLCTPSHTVPHQEKHPSGERFYLRKRQADREAGTSASGF